MTGGEPFLYPDFVGLCAALTRSHYISLNSNLPTSKFYQFAYTIDPKKVMVISAAAHISEREKSKNGVERFIEKVVYLQEKGFNVFVSYVTEPSLFPRIEKDFEQWNSMA
jgi:organic radical activating enzyme